MYRLENVASPNRVIKHSSAKADTVSVPGSVLVEAEIDAHRTVCPGDCFLILIWDLVRLSGSLESRVFHQYSGARLHLVSMIVVRTLLCGHCVSVTRC